MVKAITQKFEQMVLEVETDTEGVFARLCGMMDVTVTRSAQLDSSEIPDCDDESLPLEIEKETRTLDVTVSATGVWAQQSHQTILDWWYSGAAKNIRIGNLNADVGDTEYETGPAFLTNVRNQRTKGSKVSAEIDIEFNGLPTRSAKAA